MDLLIAVSNAVIVDGGRSYRIRKGETIVKPDDRLVRGREHLFRPLEVKPLGHRSVEQATAVPGERRELSKPPAEPDVDMAAVRAWAREQGIDTPSRGRLPVEIVEQYKAAQQDEE